MKSLSLSGLSIDQEKNKLVIRSVLLLGLAFVDGKETGWISLTAWNELSRSLMNLPKNYGSSQDGSKVNNYTNREGKKTSKLFIKIHSIQKCQVSYTLIAQGIWEVVDSGSLFF